MTTLIVFAGILLLCLSVAGMMYFMPRKGRIHPWVTKPMLESGIPLTIMISAGMGVALLASAFV